MILLQLSSCTFAHSTTICMQGYLFAGSLPGSFCTQSYLFSGSLVHSSVTLSVTKDIILDCLSFLPASLIRCPNGGQTIPIMTGRKLKVCHTYDADCWLDRGKKLEDYWTRVHCKLFEDNIGALEMAVLTKMRPMTKHIGIWMHHIREHVKKELITIHRKPLGTNWLI